MNFLKRTDQHRMFKVTAKDGQTAQDVQLSYTREKVVGNGSFGVVYQAKLQQSGEVVAIKKVLQDRRYENRELQIIRSVYHPNIIAIKAFFYTQGDQKKDEIYLNLVLEYMPETLYRTIRRYVKARQTVPSLYVKLYIYQLLRSLAYLHSLGICHRDIKPQNLLLDPTTGVLKLCDFGSAKALIAGKPNVSYICSRYYRAPELLFGATNYTTAIDIWSSGCVMAEAMLGQPLFQGDRNIEQLVEIIKIRGTPTKDQLLSMNPNYMESKLPQIKPRLLSKVFPSRTQPEAIDVLSLLLEYVPGKRPEAMELLAHPYFDELRDPSTKMIDGKNLPELFDFTYQELSARPDLLPKIVPLQYEKELVMRGIDIYSIKPL